MVDGTEAAPLYREMNVYICLTREKRILHPALPTLLEGVEQRRNYKQPSKNRVDEAKQVYRNEASNRESFV